MNKKRRGKWKQEIKEKGEKEVSLVFVNFTGIRWSSQNISYSSRLSRFHKIYLLSSPTYFVLILFICCVREKEKEEKREDEEEKKEEVMS